MGWKVADGYIYSPIDVIFVGGSNVYPAKVEAALDEHPKIASSCVVGLREDEYGNRVHAIGRRDRSRLTSSKHSCVTVSSTATRQTTDAVAMLNRRLASGESALKFEKGTGY